MSFDLNVLCILQKESITDLPFDSSICFDILNRNAHDFPKGYDCDVGWSCMGAMPGYWYYLYTPGPNNEETFMGSFYLCDYFSDDETEDINIGPGTKFADLAKKHGGVTIRDPYKDELYAFIEYLVDQSPIRTVMFLARYQSESQECVLGVFMLDTFISMLKRGEVSFNVCYIIQNP